MQSCAEMSGVRGFSFLCGDRTADARSSFVMTTCQASRLTVFRALWLFW
ncbi:hypothetical protein RCH14_003329 [Massilia sp. MP_M2]